MVGLYAAFMMGLLTSVFGGRPGMISGATGATAVVMVSALVFAWQHAKHIGVETSVDENGYKVYALRGPIFFGSVTAFKKLFDAKNDPRHVVIEFQRSRVSDYSGIEALDGLAEKYQAEGKTLHLRHLSPECRKLLKRAGDLCEVIYLQALTTTWRQTNWRRRKSKDTQ